MSDTKYTVRDGFQVCEDVFPLPTGLSELDSATQQDLNICNLFVNEKFTISDIIRLADEDYKTVVRSLLKQKAIVDRRQKNTRSASGTERRKAEDT
jgi:hypothetical protein